MNGVENCDMNPYNCSPWIFFEKMLKYTLKEKQFLQQMVLENEYIERKLIPVSQPEQ